MKLLTLAVLAVMSLGCAPKKTVRAIQGPASARYRLSDCKPLPGFQPGLECNHVKLIPQTLPVPK